MCFPVAHVQRFLSQISSWKFLASTSPFFESNKHPKKHIVTRIEPLFKSHCELTFGLLRGLTELPLGGSYGDKQWDCSAAVF